MVETLIHDGLPSFCDHRNAVARRNDPALLRIGSIVIPPGGLVQIVRSGNIHWDSGPRENRAWHMFFHSLQWLERLIQEDAEDGGKENLATALWYARSWVETHPELARNEGPWHDHATSMRALTLVCLRCQGVEEDWLLDALDVHGKVLRDERRYAGPYNHGINQDLSLIALGTVLGQDEWVDFAGERLGRVARTSISSQGVLDEQAPEYSNYLWALWSRAVGYLNQTGRSVPEGLDQRLARMPEFMAHATLPDGRYVPFGDSYRRTPISIPGTAAEYVGTKGKSGRRPASAVRVYTEGYVFGRSGWGERRPFSEESYYAIRFGPARYRHGHHDHMSFVYAANGRLVVTDSGHCNYQRDEYRSHLVSPAAHNVVDVLGSPIDPNHHTELVSAENRRECQLYELSDVPYPGVHRFRRLAFMLDWDVVVVHDVVSGERPRRYRQLTHLDPALDVAVVGLREVWGGWNDANSGDIRIIELLNTPVGSPVNVAEGADDPILGWISYDTDQRDPAPVVVYEAAGHEVEFLTVICCRPDVRVSLVPGIRRRLKMERNGIRRVVEVPEPTRKRPRIATLWPRRRKARSNSSQDGQ